MSYLNMFLISILGYLYSFTMIKNNLYCFTMSNIKDNKNSKKISLSIDTSNIFKLLTSVMILSVIPVVNISVSIYIAWQVTSQIITNNN